MKDAVYLVFNNRGVQEMKKRPPKLRAGQYAVKITVDVDSKFFHPVMPVGAVRITEGMNPQPNVTLQQGDVEEAGVGLSEEEIEALDDEGL